MRASRTRGWCSCLLHGRARGIHPRGTDRTVQVARLRALLYDIHGNLPALEAVVADARAAGAKQFVLGGDYALAGALPQETVKRLGSSTRSGSGATRSAGSRTRRMLPMTSCCTGRSSSAASSSGASGRRSCSSFPSRSQIDGACVCHASPRSDILTFMPEPTGGDHQLLDEQQRGHRDLRAQPPPVLTRGGGAATGQPWQRGVPVRRRSPRGLRALGRRPRLRAAARRVRLGRATRSSCASA